MRRPPKFRDPDAPMRRGGGALASLLLLLLLAVGAMAGSFAVAPAQRGPVDAASGDGAPAREYAPRPSRALAGPAARGPVVESRRGGGSSGGPPQVFAAAALVGPYTAAFAAPSARAGIDRGDAAAVPPRTTAFAPRGPPAISA